LVHVLARLPLGLWLWFCFGFFHAPSLTRAPLWFKAKKS
jgi:hypothetical protein